jgi:hypothetical protein
MLKVFKALLKLIHYQNGACFWGMAKKIVINYAWFLQKKIKFTVEDFSDNLYRNRKNLTRIH